MFLECFLLAGRISEIANLTIIFVLAGRNGASNKEGEGRPIDVAATVRESVWPLVHSSTS